MTIAQLDVETCKRGHLRTPENTMYAVDKSGHRKNYCRTCAYENSRASHARERERRYLTRAAAGYLVGEVWLPIPCSEGYEVSSFGRVRRTPLLPNGVHGRVRRTSLNSSGYPSLRMPVNGIERTMLVHRLVAAAFIGPCPPGMQVNHIDLDKTNPRAENLEYVTGSQNQRHAAAMRGARLGSQRVEHVRHLRGSATLGERNGSAKLTEADVREIRTLCAAGRSRSELSRHFGVDRAVIRRIDEGRSWASVT